MCFASLWYFSVRLSASAPNCSWGFHFTCGGLTPDSLSEPTWEQIPFGFTNLPLDEEVFCSCTTAPLRVLPWQAGEIRVLVGSSPQSLWNHLLLRVHCLIMSWNTGSISQELKLTAPTRYFRCLIWMLWFRVGPSFRAGKTCHVGGLGGSA